MSYFSRNTAPVSCRIRLPGSSRAFLTKSDQKKFLTIKHTRCGCIQGRAGQCIAFCNTDLVNAYNKELLKEKDILSCLPSIGSSSSTGLAYATATRRPRAIKRYVNFIFEFSLYFCPLSARLQMCWRYRTDAGSSVFAPYILLVDANFLVTLLLFNIIFLMSSIMLILIFLITLYYVECSIKSFYKKFLIISFLLLLFKCNKKGETWLPNLSMGTWNISPNVFVHCTLSVTFKKIYYFFLLSKVHITFCNISKRAQMHLSLAKNLKILCVEMFSLLWIFWIRWFRFYQNP